MDVFLFHGKIWLGEGHFADALLVRKGRVAAVGRQQELYPLAGDCSFIDCGGRTVIPGIFDACLCLAAACSPLPEGKPGLAEACKVYLASHRRQGKKGAHLFWRSGGANLSRSELDNIWPGAPLVLEDVAAGCAWANTSALQALEHRGMPASILSGVDFDGEGHPTGIFHDTACRMIAGVVPGLRQEAQKQQLTQWLRQAARAGITTVQSMDVGCSLGKNVLQVAQQLYRETPQLPRLQFLCSETLPPPRSPQSPGSQPAFGGRMVPLSQLPRLQRQGGQFLVPTTTRQQLEDLLERLRKHPLPQDNPRRLTLLGGACTDSRQMQEMGESKLGVIAFPGVLEDSLASCAAQPGVSLDTCCAWRTLSRLGCRVAFGGLDRMTPFISLQKVLCRQTVTLSGRSVPSKEALSLEEGLAAMTVNGAWTDFQEDLVGRLRCGWRADLLVLDRDLFSCPLEEVGSIRPVLTMTGGLVLHREI